VLTAPLPVPLPEPLLAPGAVVAPFGGAVLPELPGPVEVVGPTKPEQPNPRTPVRKHIEATRESVRGIIGTPSLGKNGHRRKLKSVLLLRSHPIPGESGSS